MYFVTFVFKSLLQRKLRSALTCVGVAVAVAAVVALVGVSRGFERSFGQLYERRGVDLVVLRAGIAERLTSNVDERIGARLQVMPGVRAVTSVLLDIVSFENSSFIGVPVQGWPVDSFMFDDLKILTGRRLHAGDTKVVMLGGVLANNLDKRVGDTIEIEGEECKIVGTFESFNVFENGSAVVLLGDLQRLMDRRQQVTGFMIVLDNTPDKEAQLAALRTEIQAMTDARGRPLHLAAMATQDHVRTTLEIRVTHSMAWLTSAIALFIGTIGMINTMLMSVFERTQEIGILRALGWKKMRVLRMILLESLTLSMVGAVLGVAGGILLTQLLIMLPDAGGLVSGDIDATVIAQSIGIALLVGLFGGLYPAFRAARLLPTEAMRHE